MQKSLAVKSAELETKNLEANEKLKQMVKDQQEAEKQKQQSIEISQVLNPSSSPPLILSPQPLLSSPLSLLSSPLPWQLVEKQTKEIATKKSEVMKDLERVEPAVIDAQNAVKSIKKQHLVEVRRVASSSPHHPITSIPHLLT